MSAGLLRSLVRSTSFTAAPGPAARLQQPLVKRWKSGKTTSKSTAKATKKTASTQTLSHLKTLEEEESGTEENPIFFKDPDRLKRMLSFNERNFTKDGFDEVTPIRHGLGDFRTPQPGPYPDNLPGSDQTTLNRSGTTAEQAQKSSDTWNTGTRFPMLKLRISPSTASPVSFRKPTTKGSSTRESSSQKPKTCHSEATQINNKKLIMRCQETQLNGATLSACCPPRK